MQSPFHPTNWSQACASWIHEIQVVFEPPIPVLPGRGGFLRLMRWSTPRVAALVALSFTLHCTRPPSSFPDAPAGSRGAGRRSAHRSVAVNSGSAWSYSMVRTTRAGTPTAML